MTLSVNLPLPCLSLFCSQDSRSSRRSHTGNRTHAAATCARNGGNGEWEGGFGAVWLRLGTETVETVGEPWKPSKQAAKRHPGSCMDASHSEARRDRSMPAVDRGRNGTCLFCTRPIPSQIKQTVNNKTTSLKTPSNHLGPPPLSAHVYAHPQTQSSGGMDFAFFTETFITRAPFS